MAEHPIQGLMKTAMESIKEMIEVNTIVGDPVETQDGSVIIPISRVSFGFAAGGGDFELSGDGGRGSHNANRESESAFPFAGGSGAGVVVHPVGFLVVGQGTVRLLPVDGGAVIDRLIDLAPQVLQQVGSLVRPGSGGEGKAGSTSGKTGAEYRSPAEGIKV